MEPQVNTPQVSTADGYVAILDTPEGKHTLGICNMTDKAAASMEASIEDVLKIEEVRHKGRYSVAGYEEEIEWTIRLLQSHLQRIAAWKDAPEEDRRIFTNLDEFLSQFEEM
jgi:hypothetical protein